MSERTDQPPFVTPSVEGDRKKTEYCVKTLSGSWSGYKYSVWNAGDNSSTETWSGEITITYTKDPDTGEVTMTYSGSHSWSEVQTFPIGPPLTASSNWDLHFDGSNFEWINGSGIYRQRFPIATDIPGWPYPTNTTVVTSDSSVGPVRTVTFDQRDGGAGGTTYGTGAYTISLSDPVVTDYPGLFEEAPIAAAADFNAFPNAVKYDLKWRVKHDPTYSAYLKVWLQKNGSSILALTPYEWTGVGNPCLPEPFLPPSDPANAIRSEAATELAPDAGAITIEIPRFSFLPGYTPPGDGSANGWPVPS